MKRSVFTAVSIALLLCACTKAPKLIKYEIDVKGPSVEKVPGKVNAFKSKPGEYFSLTVSLSADENEISFRDVNKIIDKIEIIFVNRGGDTLLSKVYVGVDGLQYNGEFPDPGMGDLVGYLKPHWNKKIVKSTIRPGIFSEPFIIQMGGDKPPASRIVCDKWGVISKLEEIKDEFTQEVLYHSYVPYITIEAFEGDKSKIENLYLMIGSIHEGITSFDSIALYPKDGSKNEWMIERENIGKYVDIVKKNPSEFLTVYLQIQYFDSDKDFQGGFYSSPKAIEKPDAPFTKNYDDIIVHIDLTTIGKIDGIDDGEFEIYQIRFSSKTIRDFGKILYNYGDFKEPFISDGSTKTKGVFQGHELANILDHIDDAISDFTKGVPDKEYFLLFKGSADKTEWNGVLTNEDKDYTGSHYYFQIKEQRETLVYEASPSPSQCSIGDAINNDHLPLLRGINMRNWFWSVPRKRGITGLGLLGGDVIPDVGEQYLTVRIEMWAFKKGTFQKLDKYDNLITELR